MDSLNNVFDNRCFIMKKAILGTVILITVVCALFLVYGIVRKLINQKLISEKISSLPSFCFMTLSAGSFNSADIGTGPVLVVHYHPECEHCQYEIPEILKSNIPSSFKFVLLVSSAHPDSVRRFLALLKHSDSPSVIPLADTSFIFENIFGSGIIPSSYIYNRKLKLIKVISGEVKPGTILKYLHESE